MIISILLLCVVAVVSYLAYYGRKLSHLPTINGPWNAPFIGILYEFVDKTNVLHKLMQLHNKYGPTYRGYFVSDLRVFTMDPELIELVTTSRDVIDKSKAYKAMDRWLGNGLLTSSGEKWQTHRKIISPAYHFSNLPQFIEIFNNNANIMIDQLYKEVDKPSIDILHFVRLCSLDIICEAAMGTQIHAQLDGASDFVKATTFMSIIPFNRSFSTLKSMEFIYKLTGDFRREQAALKVMHDLTINIIKQRRTELENTEHIATQQKDTFLDTLLKSTHKGPALTDEEIREEVNTFTFAGHDTSSTAISFTLFLISNHPSVLEKLRLEQADIFKSDINRPVTYEDLNKMKYLELVIKESLRMYPPVPFLGRQVNADVNFKGNIIPKGTVININTFALHMDPRYYPEPEMFIPERFLKDGRDEHKNSPYAYIPFSAGYRNCVGQKFAWLEMKTIISKLIRKFEFLPAVPRCVPLIQTGIILRSGNGLLLRIKSIA